MKTVKSRTITKIEIKKSLFIAVIDQIHHKTEFPTLLEEIKKKYPNATHYCYAYIIDQEKYSNDDKEPAKSAGLPILNVLEMQKLNHVYCIVIRYFGGIKLGSGGLIRAYSTSVQEVIKKSNLIEYKLGIQVKIIISYEQQKQLNYLLKETIIEEKIYQEKIIYLAKITPEVEKTLQKNKISYVIIKSCYIPI